MRTDDFLADLEAQLRDTRPRRDLRPVLAIVPVALVVAARLVLAPRGGGDRARPAGVPGARVALLNGTADPDLPHRVADRLSRAGYAIVPLRTAAGHDLEVTTVTASAPRFEDEADAIRRLLNAPPQPRRGWTAYAPLNPDAEVVVDLGGDQLPPPEGVRIVDASGRPGYGEEIARRLDARGVRVLSTRTAPPRFATTMTGPVSGEGLQERVIQVIAHERPEMIPRHLSGDTSPELVLGRDLPLMRAVESALHLGRAACYGRDEHGSFLVCRIDGRRTRVPLTAGGCIDGGPLTVRGQLAGCGPRP
jgi:hypothetical protein